MELTRRNFLKSAAAAAGVASVGALAGASTAHADEVDEEDAATEEAGTITYDQTIEWDGQYDVVVVGFGAAGASTAIAAADAGANVLIVEKAPLGNEGGNSRLCAQLFAYGQDDLEETQSYWKQLNGDFEVPDDMFEVYTEGIAGSAHTYAEIFGLDENDFLPANSESGYSGLEYMCPEYPEFVTNEDSEVLLMMLHDGYSDSFMWQNWRQQVVNRSESIDVWLESPATELIQEPNTKTILGVTVSRGGEELNIRATNGVVLTCGGFENNRTMIEDYIHWSRSSCVGTAYNTGDGINMAKAAGADLWHMNMVEGPASNFTYVTYNDAQCGSNLMTASGAAIVIGGDGYRFLNETETLRHGHRYNNGTWDMWLFPSEMYIVFDSTNSSKAEAYSEHGEVFEADTISELAVLIGADPDILEQTVSDYNSFAEAGYDPAYHRDADTMQPLQEAPFYAIETIPSILNTQGGPRRNANAEIVDVDGNAIPHLYGAGECGGICSNMYQGGGNMAECMIFGQIAGKNAAAEKDPLDAYVVEAVESDLAYTIGVANDIAEEDLEEKYGSDLADNEYIGSATGIGGDIVVKVTTDDGVTISDLEVLEEYETESVGGAALEELVPAIIEAGTTEGIDAVSGATVTSTALFEAIAEALAQAAE